MKIYKNPDLASAGCNRCGTAGGCGGCGGCGGMGWLLPCLCCICRHCCNNTGTADEETTNNCRCWCGENGTACEESDSDENGTCDNDRRHRCERLGCWDDCYDEFGNCRKCYNYCGTGYATEQVLGEICARSPSCSCKSDSLCDRTLSDICGDRLTWEKPHRRCR